MELSIRTPYKVLCNKLTDFTRVITKTNEAILCVQSRMPPAAYILPPGSLKVRLNTTIPGFSGDFMHMGGFLVIHADNSCEINLIECVDK